MIFPVDEKWRIASYYHGWRIEQSWTRNGNKEWEPKKWFGSYEGAVRELGELMVRTSNAQTLAEALEEVKNVSTILSQALTPEISPITEPDPKGKLEKPESQKLPSSRGVKNRCEDNVRGGKS